MRNWSAGLVQVPDPGLEIEDWWKSSLNNLPKADRRIAAGLLMYTAWNIWKERNRRVFQGISASASQVFALIKEELGLRHAALRVPGVS
ncbi:hypothetical protein C2845_PM01G13320 [Panicum miliaceum]|uniref:Uncharacterized protein n=1 Tax=Panicum miliaceum TaxID=4540 RepID=A0A3L6TKT2_PANMI|nr:hypothetical protein C2845_PM01G13320 [Panicum miliaceum]